MSYQAMEAVQDHSQYRTGTREPESICFRLLLAIARLSNRHGVAGDAEVPKKCPSNAQIGTIAGMHRNTVSKYLKLLEISGELQIDRQQAGTRILRVFTILLPIDPTARAAEGNELAPPPSLYKKLESIETLLKEALFPAHAPAHEDDFPAHAPAHEGGFPAHVPAHEGEVPAHAPAHEGEVPAHETSTPCTRNPFNDVPDTLIRSSSSSFKPDQEEEEARPRRNGKPTRIDRTAVIAQAKTLGLEKPFQDAGIGINMWSKLMSIEITAELVCAQTAAAEARGDPPNFIVQRLLNGDKVPSTPGKLPTRICNTCKKTLSDIEQLLEGECFECWKGI
ncbi:MAG: hypothetical protein GY943_11885 [Chloroflexi bacterium]|nr:hypothetical protein [Chloroflexota bacterium]